MSDGRSPPWIFIHSIDDARAALKVATELGVAVTLASAAGAGCYAGPAWFKALVAEAAAEVPGAAFDSVLDCAEEAGTVLAALRTGLKRVGYSATGPARARLEEIAASLGAAIEPPFAGESLDLRDVRDPEWAVRAFLARAGTEG